MLERDIETKLLKRIRKLGGMCEKFTSPSHRSVPDRIVTLPGGKMYFVELKRPGGKVTEKQQMDHDRRRALGCEVYVIDTVETIDKYFPIF